MSIRYPNGKPYRPLSPQAPKRNVKEEKVVYSNRGMSLEADINESNEYYLANARACIHKKPTPVQIVSVDYPKRSAAVIKEAYFKQPSTTDYNGVYRGMYIDFEAKETKNLQSFPLSNIHPHQITHSEHVLRHGGICFFLIRFQSHNETLLIDAQYILSYWQRMNEGGRKSFTFDEAKAVGLTVPEKYQPRLDYLGAVDDYYF